jgi:polysaccharide export outer membrane protein
MVLLLSSCRVLNPSQMLRTTGNVERVSVPDSLVDEYRIAPDDVISFMVLPNKGERIVSGLTDQLNQNQQVSDESGLKYVVEPDGTVKLPMLGFVKFGGLNRREAEAMLEKLYADYINDPWVKLSIDNRRVFVFSGSGSQVVKLENQNTTLFEVLAQAGGTQDSKAHRIKLIRKENGTPKVFFIDLSRAENLDQGNIVLQSNDVVYITPRDRVPERIIAIVTPYLSLLATAFAAIALFK